MGVDRFEDLIAWQKARILTRRVYEVTKHERFSRDFGLSNQIQRAAVSIMANIAEGFERGSPPDFHRFLVIAKASCAEVRSHLYIALDAGYLMEDDFNELMNLSIELSRIIGGLRASVEKKKY
jgi:four helix bundle protein